MDPFFLYPSPAGELVLSFHDGALSGLWFSDQKNLPPETRRGGARLPLPDSWDVSRWLDAYFRGENPAWRPPLFLDGTPFRLAVWNILLEIPYGERMTYGQVAEKVRIRLGAARMSAQAAGSAVGRNPVSIIVPCHRVVSAGGGLGGYAGGLRRKELLLRHESAEGGACVFG
ncbi:MAG: methylated-DNA--[Succinivibrionaceae bacterium]|nr:methylated-DNA--[protein]-cysteine S-methyltransferase [Succinivibrionaceae bacterium]